MQLIKFAKYQPGEVARFAVRLFADCSTDPLPTVWANYPVEAFGLIKQLKRGADFNLFERPFADQIKARDFSCALVGFSGGKDSTAAALKLRAKGFNPILFHVKGINQSYPGERRAAEKVAVAIGAKLIVLDLKLSGKSAYFENPAKNQVILGFMVDYGRQKGIANYAQGGANEDSCADLNFVAGYSDGREMYQAADKVFQAALDGYRFWHGLLENDTDSLLTLLSYAPGVLQVMQSCMMPVRYKGNLTKGNENKYGVKLLPGRCGSCYKCASEWLHLALSNFVPWSDSFALHSMNILNKGLQVVRGAGVYSFDDLMTMFFDLNRLPAAAKLRKFAP